MQALFLPFPELLVKLRDPAYECPNLHCFDGGCPSKGSHKLSIHDPFGHFTLFGRANKANVLDERYSSDTFVHNAIMEFVADETQKVKDVSFARESSLAFSYPILLKPGEDDASPVDCEELHVDGIATLENTISRCALFCYMIFDLRVFSI